MILITCVNGLKEEPDQQANKENTMSHFTTVKTKFTDQNTLVESLKELGYNQVKVGTFQCRGYEGNQTTVEILIELQGGYDIGFVNKTDSYEMVADWWGIKSTSQTELTSKLNQRYSILATKQELKNKGFSLNEEILSNGTVRLVARKLGG